MDRDSIKKLLDDVAGGRTGVEEALDILRKLPFEDTGYARIDHHRELRRGFPEVIFCEGKKPEQIVGIASKILESGSDLLATRCPPRLYSEVSGKIEGAVYHEEGRLFAVKRSDTTPRGFVAVVAGGTSDRPVSEEAALTAEYLGCGVERFYDVGVAGLHRLLSSWDRIREADVIIVVAGMEGALASVVAGMADAPVIAVPTSIGYGASFGGLAALLTMLNSCAGGVTVVNIDNGFGAAYAAAVICRKLSPEK
jgi:NCAIR mutase (PurE)-related protein